MSRPRITIVIATFNSADTLERCIDSVITQSYENLELIVIDGGSTDGTVDIINKYSKYISYWVSEADRGIYHAWNKGVVRANGQWIAFLGSDDEFSSTQSVETLASVADERYDYVFARVAIVDAGGRVLRTHGEPWDWRRMRSFQCIAHPGALHNARLFKDNGLFSEKYRIAGDYEFLVRSGATITALFLDHTIVNFSAGGVSSRRDVKLLKEVFEIQTSCLRRSAFAAALSCFRHIVLAWVPKPRFRKQKTSC